MTADPAIVNAGSPEAVAWPTASRINLETSYQSQNFHVRICGHEIGHTNRRVYARATNCVWIVCNKGGKVIT